MIPRKRKTSRPPTALDRFHRAFNAGFMQLIEKINATRRDVQSGLANTYHATTQATQPLAAAVRELSVSVSKMADETAGYNESVEALRTVVEDLITRMTGNQDEFVKAFNLSAQRNSEFLSEIAAGVRQNTERLLELCPSRAPKSTCDCPNAFSGSHLPECKWLQPEPHGWRNEWPEADAMALMMPRCDAPLFNAAIHPKLIANCHLAKGHEGYHHAEHDGIYSRWQTATQTILSASHP